MLRFGIFAAVCVCLALLVPVSSRAALDLTGPLPDVSNVEIVVVEAPGCIYCHLFRRDIGSPYELSERAKTIPMRFIDLNSEAVDHLTLAGPIESLPTALIVRETKEIGRIPGYVGPETFFYSIDRLLAGSP